MRSSLRAAVVASAALALVASVLANDIPAAAASGTLYVNGSSGSCNDAGTGTSTAPFCTITKAAQVVLAGQTVSVVGGTYTGTSLNPAATGSSGSPITFTASAGVTITGGANAFAISGRSYIVINGFTVSGTSADGIDVSSSDHITISNNNVTGSGTRSSGQTAPGISLSGTTASLVTHNTSDNNSDPGILLHGGSSNNLVSYNEASLNAEGYQRNAQGIDVTDTGTTGNTLLGNVVHDNEDSGMQFYPGANNNLAINNISYNNGDHGIDDLNVTGGRLIGNTVYHNCTDGINVEGTSGNYLVANNISVDNAVYPAYKGISCNRRTGNIGIYDSAPATTTADYNLVYLTTAGDLYVWGGTSYSSLTALFNATGQEQHGIQGDPKWVSPTTPNFHLVEGSPAIDSANSGASGESSTDADGNPRADDPLTPNTGAGPRSYDDRGAYELQPSSSDTQPPTVPTGLSGTATSPTSVALSWNASTDNVGVAGYTVYRNGGSIASVVAPGYVDSSAASGTTYTYAVDAFDAAGNHSGQSQSVQVTTPSDTQPPTVPTGLATTSIGPKSVGLTWNASTDNYGVAGYTVFRNGTSVGTSTTTSFTDSGLAPTTQYTYTVDAFDGAGNHSAQSGPLAVTTTAPPVTFVQGRTYSNGNRHTSANINLSSAVSAGDLLVGLFGQWDAAGQVTVSDNVNGAWTRVRGTTYSTGKGDVALYYLANSRASSTGLSVTIRATASTLLTGTVADYSGVATAAPLDQVALGSGTGLAVDSGPTSSVASGELVFGAVTGNSNLGTVTPGSSQGLAFTVRSVSGKSASADILNGSAGVQDARFTLSGSVTWYAVAATFRSLSMSADTTPPSTPTGLSAANAGQSVALSWNASSDNVGVAGYTVYRNGSALGTVSGSSLTYTDGTVASATTYTYTVDAFDSAGNHSAQSAPASDTTLDWTAPSVPGNVSAAAASSTQVNVSWSASTDNVGVSGYTVYRNGSVLSTVSGSTLTYSDTTVAASTTYTYTVDAFDAAGNHSAQSAAATVTTPGQGGGDTTPPTVPTGVAASATGPTQVVVSWSASSDNVGVAGYTVYRNGATLTTVTAPNVAYVDNSVSPATNYTYTVDAFDTAGNHSAQSAPASVHVPAQIKFVQGKTFTGGGRVTTATTTLGPVAQGDLLVGWFGQYDSTGQVQVSDNVNGAWTRSAVSLTWSGTNGDIALFYVANAKAAPSGLTITVTVSAATYIQGAPAEYSGVAASNPLDQVSVAKGSGTSADSGLTAATGAGELVYGGLTTTNGPGTDNPGSSAGVAFVKRAQSTSGSEAFEDIVTSAAGQQHAGFTFATSTPWFMVCAVFRAA